MGLPCHADAEDPVLIQWNTEDAVTELGFSVCSCTFSAGMQLHMCCSLGENVHIILALPQPPVQHHEMVLVQAKAWVLFDLSYPWILDMGASRFKLLSSCSELVSPYPCSVADQRTCL